MMRELKKRSCDEGKCDVVSEYEDNDSFEQDFDKRVIALFDVRKKVFLDIVDAARLLRLSKRERRLEQSNVVKNSSDPRCRATKVQLLACRLIEGT